MRGLAGEQNRNENECVFQCHYPSQLKTHQANVHGINATFHPCGHEGCAYKSKIKSHIKRHLDEVHSNCESNEYICSKVHRNGITCSFKTNRKENFKRHEANTHSINVRCVQCKEPRCSFETKTNSDMKSHLKHWHSKNV